jgi:hypothetical protein
MIIPRTKTPPYEPDLSGIDLTKWSVASCQINPDGETYTCKLRWIAPYSRTITATQGRTILKRIGKLSEVKQLVEGMGAEAEICWEYDIEWEADNPVIMAIADKFGLDIPTLFDQASKI